MAVRPLELRRRARTLAAKAAALAASLTRVQSTVTACLSRIRPFQHQHIDGAVPAVA